MLDTKNSDSDSSLGDAMIYDAEKSEPALHGNQTTSTLLSAS